MRIVTWNVNSIRARLALLTAWLEQHRPDVICLQETKCSDADLPLEALGDLGYRTAHHGIDHWNGVAICSRVGLGEVERGFSGVQRAPFDEPRSISAVCGGLRVWSVYVPNGRELWDPHYAFKLVWLERLRHELATGGRADLPTVVAGDFNVAPADIDIYMPSRWRRRTHASPPERAAIVALLDLGLHDITRELHPEPGVYTWWNYRTDGFAKDQGLRIDLALVDDRVAAATTGVWIDREVRAAPRPSDHAPLVLEIDSDGAGAAARADRGG
ncbi:MAG: exodeoxyribonuclease III [Acidimicrobiales bacterium]